MKSLFEKNKKDRMKWNEKKNIVWIACCFARPIRWYFVHGAKNVLCTKLELKLAAVFNAVY